MTAFRLITAPIVVVMSVFLLGAAPSWAQGAGDNPCVSTDAQRSDNEAWTTRSWELFNAQDYAGAIANVNACLVNWDTAAEQAQDRLASSSAPPPVVGPASAAEQAAIHRNGLLNDVAASYWILGRSHQLAGDANAARDAYTHCARFEYARTWDPKGWFWAPAQDCASRLRRLR